MSDGKNVLDGQLYTKTHEWVRIEDDIAVVGVTDFAQHALGDIVGLEMIMSEGDSIEKGESIAALDSVKSSTDVFSPVSGEIVEVNSDLESQPENISASPYEDGFLVKIRYSEAPGGLMNPDEYRAFIETQEH